ncbi:hypothetical protein FRB99_006080 [Tulasnella sp. 403]|nr:hypothetical protein FRB99_006080 [Tulasnella sp. 403]
MPTVTKKETEKTPTLKGKEAEDRVLQYMKEVGVRFKGASRPLLQQVDASHLPNPADVSANLKNAVSKPATQKILTALAERGAITQKTYGKTSYFVANQSECEDMSVIQLDALEAQAGILQDEIKELNAQHKQLSAEITRVRSTPRDSQLESDIANMHAEIEALETVLAPLRAGSALLSDEQVQQLDQDWTRWRTEWTSRKRVFHSAWGIATDSLNSADAETLAEDLGMSPPNLHPV